MKMLNVNWHRTNMELTSGDKLIDLHSLIRVFPTYRWDSTYKDGHW